MKGCGKLTYRGRTEALRALESAKDRRRAEGSERYERRVYWCQKCLGFHLTSQPLRSKVAA